MNNINNITPIIQIRDDSFEVVSVSHAFKEKIFDVDIGCNLYKSLFKYYKQYKWQESVIKTLKSPEQWTISKLLFLPIEIKFLNQKIKAISYWYLQIFSINDITTIIFHSDIANKKSEKIFSNFIEVIKSNQNEVEFSFHRKYKSDAKYIGFNPFIYSFFQPYLAKNEFFNHNDKAYSYLFSINPNIRTSAYIKQELDKLEHENCYTLPKIKQILDSVNLIPYASLRYPLIIDL